MAGEGTNILDQLGLRIARCLPANALPYRNTDTRRTPHEGAKNKLAFDDPIETRPVQIGEEIPQERRDIGHVGDRIGFSAGQGFGGINQLPIGFGLGRIGIGSEIEHRRDVARAA